jgi:hypothetical protein
MSEESQQNLPQETEAIYAELATQASSPEEQQVLSDMHIQDLASREEAIADIANAPLPDVDANGVAILPSESEELKNSDDQEYGQGGPRA